MKNIYEFAGVNFEPEMISGGESVEGGEEFENKLNPSIRSEQVLKPIIDETGESRKLLTRSQKDLIQKN